MLALVGLTLAVVFIVLWRTGVLDDLPEILGNRPPKGRVPEQIENSDYDPDKDRRLDIFKNYLEGESSEEEEQ
jgi:hypothetical protein